MQARRSGLPIDQVQVILDRVLGYEEILGNKAAGAMEHVQRRHTFLCRRQAEICQAFTLVTRSALEAVIDERVAIYDILDRSA